MPKQKCPDCDGELQPINILDATLPGYHQEGSQQVELSYSSPDAKPSFFMYDIKREGKVKAKMCPNCGRILLYAHPN
jgi:hypothetical protein